MRPGTRRPANVTSPTPKVAPKPEVAAAAAGAIDYGMEMEIFWEKNKVRMLVGVVAAVLAVTGYSVFEYVRHNLLVAANRQLAVAKTNEEIKKVISDFPTSPVAADAYLLLAQKQSDAKDYPAAAASAKAAADQFPDHPMRGTALLAYAANLAAAGKLDEADAAFQDVITKAPTDFAAPLALLQRGDLAKQRGKPDDARRYFDDVLARFPKSAAAQQAIQSKRFVRGGAKAEDVFKLEPAPVPEPTPSVPSLLQAPPANPPTAASPSPQAPAPSADGAAPAPMIDASTPAVATPAATPAVAPAPTPATVKPAATPAAKKK